jgi:hypothetical protein
MAKVVNSSGTPKRRRPGMTPESREQQMISLAVDLAEKQLLEGTASSQVITHYLKLGSTKERLEREILEKQRDLMEAKKQDIESKQRHDDLYEQAIQAMRNYSGHGDPDEY